MKSLKTLLTTTFSAFAIEEGGGSSGGGDASEMRIVEIRNDIATWIKNGGAAGLKLPSDLTLDTYVSKMNEKLAPKAVVIGFVSTKQEEEATDPELKVSVAGQPKTCRNFISVKDNRPHILCNSERFANTKDADQYRLVHHEYAGLAGVERNVGAVSDYAISNQLTDFLTPQTVLKLSVKKAVKQQSEPVLGITVVECKRIADEKFSSRPHGPQIFRIVYQGDKISEKQSEVIFVYGPAFKLKSISLDTEGNYFEYNVSTSGYQDFRNSENGFINAMKVSGTLSFTSAQKSKTVSRYYGEFTGSHSEMACTQTCGLWHLSPSMIQEADVRFPVECTVTNK